MCVCVCVCVCACVHVTITMLIFYLFFTDEQGDVIGKRDFLVFKYLVENKSDPRAKTILGYTPLHKAALRPTSSSFDIIKYLVENKLVGKK